MSRGKIITFYSYKGGTGRSMALANTGYCLAQWGYKVLLVDWDMEAPGLEYFFTQKPDVYTNKIGLIDILENKNISWRSAIISAASKPIKLDIITSGNHEDNFFTRLSEIDFNAIYEDGGGIVIENLRDEWTSEYDFTLIDSRTGVTDIGGICTIHLPDIVVLLFTPTKQAINGTVRIAKKAFEAQKQLPYDRQRLKLLPLISRVDVQQEHELLQTIIRDAANRCSEIFADWLHKEISTESILDLTKIPYKPFYSFYEKLAIIEDRENDLLSLRRAYENLSALLANDLLDVTQFVKDRDAFVRSAKNVFQIEISHLPPSIPDFLGRRIELSTLDSAWESESGTDIVVLVSLGGTGKSALIQHWLVNLNLDHWRGANRVFGWSFHSQGTGEDRQVTEDSFFTAALAFFNATVTTTASVLDKATVLARAICAQRTLLILDGLEPLQYPPGPLAGKLKAPGILALLDALIQYGHPGLCVITTREAIQNLTSYVRTADDACGSVRQIDLGNLSVADGAKLLHRIGVQRAGQAAIKDNDAELLEASAAVKGHALTLRMLGLYLAKAHYGDVRRRSDIDLAIADREYRSQPDSPYGHAFAAIRAYEHWLASGNDRNRRQLAVLRLLGLFDRPATPDCLRALLRAPVIDGLTEALSGITEAEWNALLADLRTAGLVQTAKWQPVTVVGYDEELAQKRMEMLKRDPNFPFSPPLPPPQAFTPPGPPLPADAETLDAHPLLREYFAKRLSDSAPEAARAGHARLFEHLSASVPYWPEGEAGLVPLYQAVAHGCRAGRYQEACAEVYRDRINRRAEFYATRKLGLYGTELSAVAHFFREPWRTPVAAPALSDSDRAWLLAVAAFDLRALGRLTEAVEPMQATVEIKVAEQDWKGAAAAASNLSELQQTLGALRAAIAAGEAAVRHADASGDAFLRMSLRTTLADARQQAGETAAALSGFAEAEALQGQRQPEYPRLYSLPGFRYCDALLQSAERTAWAAGTGAAVEEAQCLERLAELQAVEEQAALTLAWVQAQLGPLDIGLDHLTQARVSLYRSRLLAASDPQAAAAALQAATMAAGQAVDGLRKAGTDDHLPRGLLTRACVHALNADADAARADLDEAERIAERGGMKLHLADVHLHRARLFDDRTALAAARQLIDETGYERRRGELDDAQCRLDGRAVVLPEFESVLAQARGENLPEPPAAEESGEAGEPDIGALLQSLDEPTLEALLQQIDAPEIRTAIRALWEHKSGSNDRADA